MGATGSGGSDVRRVLAFLAPCEAPRPAPAAPTPFGLDHKCHALSIEALRERLKVVKALLRDANALLETAHEGFLAGNAVPADRVGAHAVEDWYERLVCEEERLELDIRAHAEPAKVPPGTV